MVLKVLSDGIVTLRSWERADAPAIVECIDGDEEMAGWLDRLPQPYTLADARVLARHGGRGEIRGHRAETGRILGSIGLRWKEDEEAGTVEIGYWLRRDAQRRGYMTRAVVLVTRYAIDRGAERVYLRADPENVASCRVAEKAGFTREGVLRSRALEPAARARQDWAIYALLPGELA